MSNLYISRTEKTIDAWETPDYFFNLLNQEFNFTLDAAASKSNTKCEKFFDKKRNGLLQNWDGETVFVNPPFGNIEEWVQKCFEEGKKENTIVVLILPSRTDTSYWHEFIMKASEIRFCKGRVNFWRNGHSTKNGSTFPLAIVVFKGPANLTLKVSSFYHKEKDLIKFRTITEFCQSDVEEVRERPLSETELKNPDNKKYFEKYMEKNTLIKFLK